MYQTGNSAIDFFGNLGATLGSAASTGVQAYQGAQMHQARLQAMQDQSDATQQQMDATQQRMDQNTYQTLRDALQGRMAQGDFAGVAQALPQYYDAQNAVTGGSYVGPGIHGVPIMGTPSGPTDADHPLPSQVQTGTNYNNPQTIKALAGAIQMPMMKPMMQRIQGRNGSDIVAMTPQYGGGFTTENVAHEDPEIKMSAYGAFIPDGNGGGHWSTPEGGLYGARVGQAQASANRQNAVAGSYAGGGNVPHFAPQIEGLIDSIAPKYNVDPALVRAFIKNESSGNANAVSPKGALGLMQLMPGTAKQLGVTNPMDPAQNIEGGIKYLAQLSRQYGGDTSRIAAAYNGGDQAVQPSKDPGHENELIYQNKNNGGYAETRAYVPKVLADYQAYQGANQAAPERSYRPTQTKLMGSDGKPHVYMIDSKGRKTDLGVAPTSGRASSGLTPFPGSTTPVPAPGGAPAQGPAPQQGGTASPAVAKQLGEKYGF